VGHPRLVTVARVTDKEEADEPNTGAGVVVLRSLAAGLGGLVELAATGDAAGALAVRSSHLASRPSCWQGAAERRHRKPHRRRP
jgi:hypothetical protein